MSNIILEVCVDTPESVRNAIEGNADRLELCSSLLLGGLTPSYGFVKFAVNYSTIPCFALIRPRNGNFVFNEDEVRIMEEDINQLKQIGVQGFVIGALTPLSDIDIPVVKRLIEAAGDSDITFHRAFDLTLDAQLALNKLIDMGVKRILTSGQQATANNGIESIRKLQRLAGDNLSLIAGAGVNELNAKTIISETGIKEIHASCKRSKYTDTSEGSKVSMGSDAEFDRKIYVTDKDKVQAIKSQISTL